MWKRHIPIPVKIAIFLLPFAIFTAIRFSALQSSNRSKLYALEEKTTELIDATSTKPGIIIAGNSRALEGIDPAEVQALTHKRAVNIAVGFATAADTYRVLQSHGDLKGSPVIIVGIQSADANDYVTSDYPRQFDIVLHAPFGTTQLDLWHQYSQYEYAWWLNEFRNLLKSPGDGTAHSAETAQLGFQGGTGVYDPDTANNDGAIASWYSEVKLDGLKMQDFLSALQGFGHSSDTVVLFVGPVAPGWKQSYGHTDAPEVEQEFAHTVQQAIAPYPNIHFIDYQTQDMPTFHDADFSDYVHLNATGAEKFTKLFVSQLIADRIIKSD